MPKPTAGGSGKEVGNVSAVMDGDLDGFIEAYLMQTAAGAAKSAGRVTEGA